MTDADVVRAVNRDPVSYRATDSPTISTISGSARSAIPASSSLMPGWSAIMSGRLKLALAEANPFDRSGVKAQKAILRAYWGQWTEAKARLERSSSRSIVTYLVDHPTDFRVRFARLRREFRTLYFSAFQSHLWNLMLARWIEHYDQPRPARDHRAEGRCFPFPRRLKPEQVDVLRESPIPLPSSRTPLPAGPLGEVIQEVLAGFQLEWPDLRVKHLKDVFFSKGLEPAWPFPRISSSRRSTMSFIPVVAECVCRSSWPRARTPRSWSNGSPTPRIGRDESRSASSKTTTAWP